MKHLSIIILIFGFFTCSYAQEIDQLNKSDIPTKFNIIIENSNNYQDYKVVKKVWLQKLKNQITDSINVSKKEIFDLESKIYDHLKTIDNLNQKHSVLENEIKIVNAEKESFSFLGSQIKKESFKSIFWATTGILLALLLFFIFKYNNSNSITKEANNKLEDLEQEFEEHRRIALEREQKVMRKLQDELNKNKA